ncbi:Orm1 type endoplasmic reticulum protein [Auriculariales sp. MPI-PUGE-AT-0066]|nr:Orm1 type endoplasmic reticulum protein [Auriculariales sp. MPI-PUGE-AT-0066]
MARPTVRLPATISATATANPQLEKRARSGSIVKVEEVGPTANDELDQTADLNSNWVNHKGAWLIHPVLILGGKILIDTMPNVTQQTSWTIVNLSYLLVCYIMFHGMTGIPFATDINGVYDDLTMWEQIDAGAQYTPAKKWLFCMPTGLFLISTHFTNYDPILFAVNFAALLVFGVMPKLPQLHRQRIRILAVDDTVSGAATPMGMRTPKSYD